MSSTKSKNTSKENDIKFIEFTEKLLKYKKTKKTTQRKDKENGKK